jgi:hypothetical protein
MAHDLVTKPTDFPGLVRLETKYGWVSAVIRRLSLPKPTFWNFYRFPREYPCLSVVVQFQLSALLGVAAAMLSFKPNSPLRPGRTQRDAENNPKLHQYLSVNHLGL